MLQVIGKWLHQLLFHVLDQEDFELFEVNGVVLILIEFVEKVLNVSLRWLFVDAMLFEVHLQKINDLISI